MLCPSARSPSGMGIPIPLSGPRLCCAELLERCFLFTGVAQAMVNALVFLSHFSSHQFFLLMTKSYCLSGINISELLPSPNLIIYISEQENSKLLKDIILPLHSAYLQRNILLRGGRALVVTIISGRHPRRVANLFFINAKDK